MNCDGQTEKRLLLLREGRLPAEERALLAQHLAEDCESCEALLEQMDPKLLLEIVGGAPAELSAKERERVQQASLRPGRWPRAALGRWLVPAAAVVTLLLVVLVAALPRQPSSSTGLKGGALQVEWNAWVGVREAAGPRLVRPFSPGEPLAAAEVLVLRFSLSQTAYVQVLAQARAQEVADVWGGAKGGVRREAGLQPVVEAGTVQALDPTLLRGPTTLAVLASPVPAPLLQRLEALSRESIASACPGCAVDLLEVRPP